MSGRAKYSLGEKTAFALGKVSAATSAHKYRHAWRIRSALPAVINWAYSDGENADSTRVWADIAGTSYHPVKDHGWDKRAARALAVVLDIEPEFPLEEDLSELEKARSWLSYSRGRTALDTVVHGYRRWLSAVGYGFAGRLAFVEALVRIGLAPLPFPALAPRRDCRAMDGTIDELLLRETIKDAAELAYEEWCAFTVMAEQMEARLSARRKNSRQQAAFLALLEAPCLSPSALAGRCNLSVEGASGILEEFVRLDIAEEITQRKWGRQFTFRDPQGVELRYQAEQPSARRTFG